MRRKNFSEPYFLSILQYFSAHAGPDRGYVSSICHASLCIKIEFFSPLLMPLIFIASPQRRLLYSGAQSFYQFKILVMRVYSCNCTFEYSWEEVSTANWRKYCPWNKSSGHVISVDTLSRSVDPSTGTVSPYFWPVP